MSNEEIMLTMIRIDGLCASIICQACPYQKEDSTCELSKLMGSKEKEVAQIKEDYIRFYGMTEKLFEVLL